MSGSVVDTPAGAASDLPDVFPPTLREVMLRPRWLGMLALCLVVAGVFAWLGQWQLGRALATAPVEHGSTEQVRPIDGVVKPGEYLGAPLVGQKVTVSGAYVPGDFILVSERVNDGVEGYWVTGQLRLSAASAGSSTPTSIAVAIGWAPTLDRAHAAIAALGRSTGAVDVVGRLVSDEGPDVPPQSAPHELTSMSPAALLGRWHDVQGLDVYRPYLLSSDPSGGLTAISSPPPDQRNGVNWLNLFYAVEWAVFAGFAFYLWYRLAKDAWEKEVEELQDAAAEGAESG
jgi:surfeit locus 1 family protein